MAGSTVRPSAADTAKQLNDQAKALWGERRTAELQGSLEDTARILTELRESLPDRGVEPGFYP